MPMFRATYILAAAPRYIYPGCSITPRECTAVGAMPCRCFAICVLAKPIHFTRAKIIVTKESPVEDLTVVTLLITDTTLDHSQKAEKVCKCSMVGICEPSCNCLLQFVGFAFVCKPLRMRRACFIVTANIRRPASLHYLAHPQSKLEQRLCSSVATICV